jgi:hypothetical protein
MGFGAPPVITSKLKEPAGRIRPSRRHLPSIINSRRKALNVVASPTFFLPRRLLIQAKLFSVSSASFAKAVLCRWHCRNFKCSFWLSTSRLSPSSREVLLQRSAPAVPAMTASATGSAQTREYARYSSATTTQSPAMKLPSAPLSLRDICANLNDRLTAFLEEEPATERLRNVQAQTRIALDVVAQALDRYRYAHCSMKTLNQLTARSSRDKLTFEKPR